MKTVIDTHCHLNFKAFHNDWKAVADECVRQGVTKMIVVGSQIENSTRARTMAHEHPALFAAVGLHPTHVTEEPLVAKEYETLARDERVVAIGEVGLDQFRGEERDSFPLQKEVLGTFVRLAHDVNKPLIIHCRPQEGALTAYAELIALLKRVKPTVPFVVHCFMGDGEVLKAILDLGGYVSFTGVITLANIPQFLTEAVRTVPLERIMLETDSPYLKPRGWTEGRNTPAGTWEVLSYIASLRSIDETELAAIVTKTSSSFFRFDAP